MRYSEMTPGQRRLVLEVGENYPLKVRFLGKVGLLSREEMAFLRDHGVDFDVDDGQVREVLARQEQLEPLLQVGEGREGQPATAGDKAPLSEEAPSASVGAGSPRPGAGRGDLAPTRRATADRATVHRAGEVGAGVRPASVRSQGGARGGVGRGCAGWIVSLLGLGLAATVVLRRVLGRRKRQAKG